MEYILVVLTVLAAAGIGVATWLFFKNRSDGTRLHNAGQEAKNITNEAEEEKRRILLAAQEEVLKQRTESEREIQTQRQEVTQLERRFLQREEQFQQKTDALEQQQLGLTQKEENLAKSQEELEALKASQLETLEEVAGLTVKHARQMVVKQGEDDAQHE